MTKTVERDIDESVRMLAQGLTTMLKIQAQQTAMLKEILAACAAPEGPSPLVETLRSIHAALDEQRTEQIVQTTLLTGIHDAVIKVPA